MPSNTTALHLYRIAQEALNNALRHGQADQIDISLSQQNGQVTLQVSDNGHGFEPNFSRHGGPTGGLGLQIMVYRADIIGGVLRIERQAHGGMRVRCVVFVGGSNLS
jgi:two-component system CheB/CheR fusion protein